MKKIFLLILDGLADRPIAELGNKTPLEAANTPNMDQMAKMGIVGLMKPFKFFGDKFPTSESAHIGMFGYKDYFLGRGPYEAAGVNTVIYDGDIALRVNFATIKDGIIVDRRAGRINDTEELINALSGIEIKGIKFDIRRSKGHRAVLIMRGHGLSSEIIGNDLHESGNPPLKVQAIGVGGEFTAEVLNEYLERVHKILESLPFNLNREYPANYLLVRGAGQVKPTPAFKEKWGLSAACVAGGGLYKGIGRILGMDVVEVPRATADIDTDLWDKFEASEKALNSHDFVFMHIKGTDVCSHDGDFIGKKDFIEKIDPYLKKFIKDDLVVAITGDHATPCALKEHSNDPVPILIYGNGEDSVSHFSEKEAEGGSLKIFSSEELISKLLEICQK